jgi:predicted secreted protein
MELSGTVRYFGILLVLMVLFAGCTGNSPGSRPAIGIIPVNGTPVVFNESDNGKIYAVPQNTEFWINLTETYATNEPWQVSFSPGLEKIGSDYYANPDSARADIEGTHRWIFRADGSGDQTFSATTGWYNDDDPRGRYNVTIRIHPASQ